MNFVPNQNLIGEQRCAVTQRAEDKRGFIHTGQILLGMDQEVFISAAAVEEMGKLIGMVPRHEIEELEKRVRAMDDEIQKVREIAEAANRLEELENELTEIAA